MSSVADLYPNLEWMRPRKGAYRHDRDEVTHDRTSPNLVPPKLVAMRLSSARTQRLDELIRTTAGQVEVLLQKSPSPWRMVATMATELDVDETVVREALEFLGDAVRRPVGAFGAELDFYASADAPLTWQEKLRVIKSAISKVPLPRAQ